jgi:hypothetical protein
MNSETQCQTDNEFIFRPRGFGRFPSAMFLSLWLCAWAVGEAVALFVLGHGIWALMTGAPVFGSDEPVRVAPLLGFGVFLLVWLTIWTVGGVMAMQELARLVWAKDRLVLTRHDLLRVRRRGPFTSTRWLTRNHVRKVFLHPSNTALMIQINANLIELTDLGTPAERAEAVCQLRTVMELRDEDTTEETTALPEDWQEAAGAHGERLLVPNTQIRRKQAIFFLIVTAVVWSVLLLLARESMAEPYLWVLTLMLTVLAAWLSSQTLWMFRGRKEWRIEHGSLLQQRRFADKVTELFQVRALELTESYDSDGDSWYHLNAIEVSASPLNLSKKTPQKIKITHSIHDPTEARCLGRWLSQQAVIPFHDRVPTKTDKQADFIRMKQELAASGEVGRFFVRLLDRFKRTKVA